MSYMLTDRKFIPIGIYHYYSAGLTREEALAHLIRSHEQNAEVFPRIAHQEVDFWYNSFDNKNFNFRQKPTQVYPVIANPPVFHQLSLAELAKLENLPVLDKIINRLGVEDQKSLRKVCKRIKSVIDTQNRLYDEIYIESFHNNIWFWSINAIGKKKSLVEFVQQDEGCEIRRDFKPTQSELDYVDAALAEFKNTVEKVNTKIKKMSLKFLSSFSPDELYERFYSGIAQIVSGLKHKLHVENLEICICKPDNLSVLSVIEKTSLSELSIECQTNGNEVYWNLDNLPVFYSYSNYLNKITISGIIIDVNIESLAHIPNLYIRSVYEVTPEEFSKYKNAISNNPKFVNHNFRNVSITNRELKDLKGEIEPSNLICEEYRHEKLTKFSGYLPIPGQSDEHIVFEMGKSFSLSREPVNQDVL